MDRVTDSDYFIIVELPAYLIIVIRLISYLTIDTVISINLNYLILYSYDKNTCVYNVKLLLRREQSQHLDQIIFKALY